jgi:hydrogenase maturation protein HypF
MFGDDVFAMKELAPLQAFSQQELAVLQTVLRRGLNTPHTSSAGRLFDAVASLVGLRQRASFEGQAAMDLEFAIGELQSDEAYDLWITSRPAHDYTPLPAPDAPLVIDWEPLVWGLLADLRQGVTTGKIAAKFHNALVEAILTVAEVIGEERVVLTGGCFQNRCLTERAIKRLRDAGFHPYWHQRVPPNDGGIALGQIMAIIRKT